MNTPNKLTVARMILVPFLVVFLLTGWGGEANRWICLAIFVAASVTDWFDGHLARKYNLITNFGKFMDPLADKLLVCSAMICMIEVDKLPAWVVIIIIGREFIISGFRLIAAAALPGAGPRSSRPARPPAFPIPVRVWKHLPG